MHKTKKLEFYLGRNILGNTMCSINATKTLTDKEIAALKKRQIDFSDIPELTDLEAKELYPKNWRV